MSKIWLFLKILFGGMWYMFHMQFLKTFSILKIFFQKNHFLTPLTPLFWKNSKFWLFLKILFGGMWHMFSTQFLKPFSILEIFFQKNHFLIPLTPLFWKKMNWANWAISRCPIKMRHNITHQWQYLSLLTTFFHGFFVIILMYNGGAL